MSLETLIKRDENIIKDVLTKPLEYMKRTYGLREDSVYELRQIYIQREIRTQGEYKK